MKSLLVIIAAVTLSACGTNEPRGYAAPSAPPPSPDTQPFSIKGYSPGQAMSSCPSDTVTQEKKGAFLACILGPSTYAGAAIKNTSLMISGGQLIAVTIDLKDRGQYANSNVLNALVQRYGQPSGSKKHINQYAWTRRNILLMFDGWKGSLALMDNDKFAAASSKDAIANQKDM